MIYVTDEIEFDPKVAEMAVQQYFDGTKVTSFLQTVYYYMIDSKFRTKKRLDSFLAEQLVKPDKKLLEAAKKCTAKTPDETILNVLKFVLEKVKYKYDSDNYSKDEYWATAIESYEKGFDDCLIWNTKLLTEDMELVNIENIEIGQKIVGAGGDFHTITNKWNKGTLPTLKITLNNGSVVYATRDHKFLLENGSEIRSNDLKVGDCLKQIEDINTDVNALTEAIALDYWYLKGLFIADGWTDKEHNSFFISGKDGFPKEAQKKWVEEYCIKHNIKYTWQERYISVFDIKLLDNFKKCGRHAIEKHVDIMPKNKQNVEALLQGLMADANVRTIGSFQEICFGTISEQLKNQIRVLYRMLGKSVKTSLVQPCKTQFGNNPIWRIYVRKRPIELKVIGIEEGSDEQVYDIEVTDHEIYLPETDCVVHNCDGINGLVFILARLAGIPSWLLYSVIGEVAGGGHYWCLYWSPRYDKLVAIDGTYFPTRIEVKSRPRFNLEGNYKTIWYLFNDKFIFRPE